MKKLLLSILGLIIAYFLYYYVARNHGIFGKIPFILTTFLSIWVLISEVVTRYKETPYGKSLGQFALVVTIFLTIVTYQTFDTYTLGSLEEQKALLDKSNSFAVGKILTMRHFDAQLVKKTFIPSRWEVEYEFNDKEQNSYSGLFIIPEFEHKKVGDTLMIKYVDTKPDINQPLYK